MRQVGRQNQNDYYQDMLDEVLAWGLKSAMVSWRGQPETDQKPSVGLALCDGNPPYVRPGKYSMDESQFAAVNRKTFTENTT